MNEATRWRKSRPTEPRSKQPVRQDEAACRFSSKTASTYHIINEWPGIKAGSLSSPLCKYNICMSIFFCLRIFVIEIHVNFSAHFYQFIVLIILCAWFQIERPEFFPFDYLSLFSRKYASKQLSVRIYESRNKTFWISFNQNIFLFVIRNQKIA